MNEAGDECKRSVIDIVDYQGAARILGIKPQSLRRMVCQRRIPFIRISNRFVRFSIHDLAEFLESHKFPVDEAEGK